MLKDFKGPCLDPHQKQSESAPFFLQIFKDMIAEDKEYINRLKRHYKLFKWVIGMKLHKDLPFDPGMRCPCGSEAKFKHCCGER
jgi:SEC-C motif